jgi:hypothetical protein
LEALGFAFVVDLAELAQNYRCLPFAKLYVFASVSALTGLQFAIIDHVHVARRSG